MKKNKLATQKTLKAELIGLSCVLSATIFSSVGLAMTNFVSAEVNKTATVHVEATCSLTKTVNTAHTVALLGGHVSEDFGTSTFSASCNDPSGYAIYAIGYSGDVMGGTDMIAASPLDSSSNIKTGTDGTDSYWAVKLTAGGSGATIENDFNDYHVIPDSYIKVAEKSSATTSSEVAFTSTYKISLADTQPAGLYNGKVKYTLVNPSTACPDGYEMDGYGECKKNRMFRLSENARHCHD